MQTKFDIDLKALPELHWHEFGQSSFCGSLLRLFNKLDDMFLEWAAKFEAEEYSFAPFLAAKQMAKLDYFKSFPHLITIPVVLDDQKHNLQAFADAPFNEDDALVLKQLGPVEQVLTPAACYHFYDELEGGSFQTKRFLTTRCVCYRREKHYEPLQRQWAFNMREIVCLGGMDEVQVYLAEFEKLLAEFFEAHNLPVKFEFATDPFFNPASNPKYLLQKLEPVKKEMIYDGHLSIGSLNFHRNFFGDTFSIKSAGQPAYSACVAFGLERWMYMILKERGLEESAWSM